MLFNDLLQLADIAPNEVALCLHKPSDRAKRTKLAILAQERPDLFEAYQSTHSNKQEATVRNRPYFASFLMAAPRELIFIGLYRREILDGGKPADLGNDPVFCEMLELVDGAHVAVEEHLARIGPRARFNMVPVPEFNELTKRLIVADPGGRQYVRLGETTSLVVLEIQRMARVVPQLPSWDRLTLWAQDIQALPKEWALQLSQWCGIYLIVDERDGERYVGAAYGEENLLGRWRDHVAGTLGVTKELAQRETATFRFSILELLSPSATVEEVTARERSWMDRLDTIRYGLNS